LLMARPLNDLFHVVDATIADLGLVPEELLLEVLIDTPKDFGVFVQFMVREGIGFAPELRELTALISAKERTLTAARREYWLPTLSLKGNLARTFGEGGAGASPAMDVSQPPQSNDTDWSIGLHATLPLYAGGGRKARVRRVVQELEELTARRKAVRDRIEQRIRRAAYDAMASHTGIDLYRAAAAAARKNLDLVTDAYVRGAVSIIDLIDAQNAFLVDDLAATNAGYDFVIDVVAIERSMGHFTILLDEKQRNMYYERLENHFRDAADARRPGQGG
ncbi:MAG: TolC family protein, partial [Deltaproteobacteria bacterium]|nr:TolC family protein [Deltaproteobacteria bacterium]